MKHFIKLIYLDLKAMSLGRFIPPIIVVAVTAYSLYMYDDIQPVVSRNLFQYFASPAVVWWVIMLFHDYVEGEGAEVLLSCRYSRYLLGIGRIFFLEIVFIILIVISLAILVAFGVFCLEETSGFILLIILQSMFYVGIGFTAVMLVKNTLWAILIVLLVLYSNVWHELPLLRILSVVVSIDNGVRLSNLWSRMVPMLFFDVCLISYGQRLFCKLGTNNHCPENNCDSSSSSKKVNNERF